MKRRRQQLTDRLQSFVYYYDRIVALKRAFDYDVYTRPTSADTTTTLMRALLGCVSPAGCPWA